MAEYDWMQLVPTDRRQFVDAYLLRLGTDDPVAYAASDCGISVAAMETQLAHPQVAAVLQRILDEEETAALDGELVDYEEYGAEDSESDLDAIDGRWVLRKLVEIAEFDVADFLVEHPATGHVHMRITDANKHLLKYLAAFKLTNMRIHGEVIQTIELKQLDKLKTLQLIGQHAQIRAWLDDKQSNSLR